MSTGKYGQRLQGARLKEQARWEKKRKKRMAQPDMYNQVVEDNRKLEAEMKLKTEDIPLDPLETIFNEMGKAAAEDLDRRAEEVLSGKVGSGAMSSTLTVDILRAAYQKIEKGALDGSMINDSKISDDYPIKDGGTFEYPNELQPKLIKKKERPKVKPGDRDLIF